MSGFLEKAQEKPKQVNRFLNQALDATDLESFGEILAELKVDTTDPMFGILMTRYHLAKSNDFESEDVDKALDYYKMHIGHTRKRHIMLVIDYLLAIDPERSYDLFRRYVIGTYDIDGSDINKFLIVKKEEYAKEIARAALNMPVAIDLLPMDESLKLEIEECKGLSKIPISDEEYATVIDNLRDKFKKRDFLVDKQIKKYADSNVRFVIDGANVMYYGERKINMDSYQRLLTLVCEISSKFKTEEGEIMIVLHERHFKKKYSKVINSIKKVAIICKTPVGLNDDWFSIIAALCCRGSFIVTNDQFRDHVFQLSQYLKIWRNECGVEYCFKRRNSVCVLKMPSEISIRIQMSTEEDDTIYVPTTDGKFIRLA